MRQKSLTLVLAMLLFACGEDKTTSTNTETDSPNSGGSGSDSESSDTSSDGGSTRRSAALTIISNNCVICHKHSGWSSVTTDSQWQGTGLVKAKDSAGSRLITMLQNSGGTMPQGGPPLSNADFQALKAWIDGM